MEYFVQFVKHFSLPQKHTFSLLLRQKIEMKFIAILLLFS